MIDPGIAYIVQTYPSRTETFIEREIDALRRQGVRITVFALAPERGLPASADAVYFSRASILRRWPFLLCLLAAAWRPVVAMYRRLRRHHPARTAAAAVVRALFVARELNARHIRHVHCHFLTMPALVGHVVSELTNRSYTLSGHAKDVFNPDFGQAPDVLAGAERIFLCTETARDSLAARFPDLPPGKLFVARHGLEFSGLPGAQQASDGPDLVAAGRLVAKKGFHHLLRALQVLVRRGRRVSLAIYGEGPMEPGLRALAAELGVSANVTFRPFLPNRDLIAAVARAKVFVNPSVRDSEGDQDGIPNVVLEAMAVGVPVVAGDIPPMREVFEDGRHVLLAPPADADAFAAAVERGLTDADLRRRLCEAASARVRECFDLGANTGPLLAEFRDRGRAKPVLLHALEATVGGTRKHINLLLHNGPGDRYDLSLVCSTLRSAGFRGDIVALERAGIAVHTVPMARAVSPARDLRALAHLVGILMNSRFDVIHLHSSKAGAIGRVAAWLCGYDAIVYSPHAFAFLGARNRLQRWFYLTVERRLARLTRCLVAVSAAEKRVAMESGIVPGGGVVVAANGLPRGAVRRRTVGGLTRIGFGGRFERQKNPLLFAEACCRVLTERPETTVRLCGEGSLRGAAERVLGPYRAARRVEFLPPCRDLAEFLETIDVLVIPSLWEGNPYTYWEAIRAGMPVVVSDIAFFRDTLGPDSPCLFRSGDVSSLVDRLLRVMDNPALLTDWMDFDRLNAASCLEDQLDVLRQVYEDLLTKHGGTSPSGRSVVAAPFPSMTTRPSAAGIR